PFLEHFAYRCALVADAVYQLGDLSRFGLPDASDEQLRQLFGEKSSALFDHSPAGGFRAKVYHDTRSESFILGFGGTDSVNPSDWLSNIQQFFGKPAEQYEQGINIVNHLAPHQKLIVTGHSLGGGIATVAAVAQQLEACVFNPPGIHTKTLDRFDLSRRNLAGKRIRRFVVAGEILDIGNKVFGIKHDRIGELVTLYGSLTIPVTSIFGLSALFKRMIPGAGMALGVLAPVAEKMAALHRMDEVFYGLRRYLRRKSPRSVDGFCGTIPLPDTKETL
ncbi:MAG: hypothetical protein LBH00_09245, partial [Planctomycetaceae bacterium]|nr:hypothetical protein [Planctomycetaceae bacterium]